MAMLERTKGALQKTLEVLRSIIVKTERLGIDFSVLIAFSFIIPFYLWIPHWILWTYFVFVGSIAGTILLFVVAAFAIERLVIEKIR